MKDFSFVSHSHTHVHSHSGAIVHSFEKGSGEELRGIAVEREMVLELAKKALSRVDRALGSNEAKDMLKSAQDLYVEVETELAKPYPKEVLHREYLEKRLKLQNQIREYEEEGQKGWFCKYYIRHSEIDALNQEIRILDARAPKKRKVKFSDYDYYFSRHDSFTAHKELDTSSTLRKLESYSLSLKELIVVAEMTSKELMLSRDDLLLLNLLAVEQEEYHYQDIFKKKAESYKTELRVKLLERVEEYRKKKEDASWE